jgi:DNA polymerase (family 10)
MNDEKLTRAQKIGLKWADRFTMSIKRDTATKIGKQIEKVLGGLVTKFEIVGSYRREKQVIKDIDILIVNKDEYIKIIDTIKTKLKIYIDYLLEGQRNFTFLVEDTLSKSIIQIDIRFFKLENYGSALLYFTGPQLFNIRSRKKAIDNGWKLYEYGLWAKDLSGEFTKRLDDNTEKSIIDLLDLNTKYYKPRCREIGACE